MRRRIVVSFASLLVAAVFGACAEPEPEPDTSEYSACFLGYTCLVNHCTCWGVGALTSCQGQCDGDPACESACEEEPDYVAWLDCHDTCRADVADATPAEMAAHEHGLQYGANGCLSQEQGPSCSETYESP